MNRIVTETVGAYTAAHSTLGINSTNACTLDLCGVNAAVAGAGLFLFA